MSKNQYQRIEVITGAARGRRWTTEQKLRIIEESYLCKLDRRPANLPAFTGKSALPSEAET
jgi:hypothetical protein